MCRRNSFYCNVREIVVGCCRTTLPGVPMPFDDCQCLEFSPGSRPIATLGTRGFRSMPSVGVLNNYHFMTPLVGQGAFALLPAVDDENEVRICAALGTITSWQAENGLLVIRFGESCAEEFRVMTHELGRPMMLNAQGKPCSIEISSRSTPYPEMFEMMGVRYGSRFQSFVRD